MDVANRHLSALPREDLDFIVRTVVKRRTDYDEIRNIIQGKADLIDVMLDDERLFRRTMADEEAILRLSPFLLFTILIRKVHRDLKNTTFTIEPVGKRERLPIFDAPRVVELLDNEDVRSYLADMLSSFTRVGTTTLYFKDGRAFSKRTFSDVDLDDVLELAEILPEDSKFSLYKRAGDICLFLTGVYPDYIFSQVAEESSSHRTQGESRKVRDMADYEREGQMFYRQAASHKMAKVVGMDRVLSVLSESFTLARKPLTIIAERYVTSKRDQWFKAWPAFGAGTASGAGTTT
ncbi:MAG TPA: hypothetical protein GX506_06670 [Firmicutes bacterium]|nr:hypothetical protein [Bacillota bacterium]